MQRQMSVIINKVEQLFKRGPFQIVNAELSHELFNGQMSPVINRMSFERGNAVGVLMVNPVTRMFLLTNQFRYPTMAKTLDNGWLYEIPAGILNANEDPIEAAKREVFEEVGYEVKSVYEVCRCFLSPGGSSEMMFVMVAVVDPSMKVNDNAGLPQEGEDIQSEYFAIDDIPFLINTHQIIDAKTIIALQWLLLNIDHI